MPYYEKELAQIVAELNRVAPPPRGSGEAAQNALPQNSESLDQLLEYAVRQGASDLLLIAGAPITLRVGGALSLSNGPPLEAEDTRSFLLPLLAPSQIQELARNRSVDLCFQREGVGRFRANLHYQRGTLAGSLRLLPEKIPTLESLNLNPLLRHLSEALQGLILVTGPTGCGKSSTLAALVDLINTHRHAHVVTIEDPVEFVHSNRQSIIEQIEVGQDAPDFAGSLRSILRQNPDVILAGEMRDPETIATVLTAAETGHLVLSTLHTIDAAKTVERIIGAFPLGEQHTIRNRLSKSFRAIVSQRLIPRNDGSGRVAIVEILKSTLRTRDYVEKGEQDGKTLLDAMVDGDTDGMQHFDGEIEKLVRAGVIEVSTGLAYATNPGNLRLLLTDMGSTETDK